MARDGKSDRLTRGGNFLKKLADMAGEVRELLNHDPGSGRTPLDAMRLFGFIADDLTRRGLEQIPVVGEQMVQGRQDINDAVSEVFEQASQASRTRLQELGRREKLSDRDIDNLGFLGEMLPDVLGIVPGGPGHRRGRSRTSRDAATPENPEKPDQKHPTEPPKQSQEAHLESPASKRPSDHLDLPDESIDEIRLRLKLPNRNTVAATATDIPGLEDKIIEGLSPTLRTDAQPPLPSLDEIHGTNRRIKSPSHKPLYTRHAEEDVLNSIDAHITNTGLSDNDLANRTVSILVSRRAGVCPVCLAGIQGLSELRVHGVIKTFSELHPTLTIRIRTARGGEAAKGRAKTLTIVDGKWINK